MKAEPLTQRQADALRFIQLCVDHDRVAPSQVEVMRALGLKSSGGAARLIEELIAKGWLRRTPGKARALTIRTRLPDEIEGDSRALAARLRRDAGRMAEGPERDGMLTAAKHYAAVASLAAEDRRRALGSRKAKKRA